MAVSPRDLLLERERQTQASDANFFKRFLMFFELRLPASVSPGVGGGPGGSFFFPLIRGPSSYHMDEPFTVEKTMTVGGGLYVEENGIIMRPIRIAGNTGFVPRHLGDVAGTPLSALKPENRSFSRRLRSVVLGAVSGHMHFMYLQDAVFRTYADYKKDPATANETTLILHNPKDQESWVVIPEKFSLKRDASGPTRTTYDYEIELTAVEPASHLNKDFSEDKDLLDDLGDAVNGVNRGFQLAQGALNDIQGIQSEIDGLIPNLDTIVDNAGEILAEAATFVAGEANNLRLPIQFVLDTADLIENGVATLNTVIQSGRDIRHVPLSVDMKFKMLEYGLETIALYPQSFETPAEKETRETLESQNLLTETSTARQDAATTPTSLQDLDNQGSNFSSGDVTSAGGEINTGNITQVYTGTTTKVLGRGDTLANLAARFLGDARLWTHIAVINGLRPPFVTELSNKDLSAEDNFPGALGVGQEIQIPNFARSPNELPLLPVLGVRPSESAERHLLGTDWKLEKVGGRPGSPVFDIPINKNSGGQDVATISGRANMAQAVAVRINTDAGTDVLYRNLGLSRVSGTKFLPTDLEAARQKFMESIDQDPRIATVRRLDFDDSSGDTLEIDAELEIRGFTEASALRMPV